MELGSTTLDHNIKTVHLQNTFRNPVVIMGACSTKGGNPITIRVKDITSNSFAVVIQEWLYLDVWHVTEDISYMVVEAGHYKIGDHEYEAGFATVQQPSF